MVKQSVPADEPSVEGDNVFHCWLDTHRWNELRTRYEVVICHTDQSPNSSDPADFNEAKSLVLIDAPYRFLRDHRGAHASDPVLIEAVCAIDAP